MTDSDLVTALAPLADAFEALGIACSNAPSETPGRESADL